MANGHRWLHLRQERDGTCRYYLRARVPLDIAQALGRREVKRSLGTSDRKEALERIDVPAAEVNEMFAEARRKLAARQVTDLTDAEVRRLAFLWFRRHDHSAADADFSTRAEDVAGGLENAGLDEAVLASGADVAEAAVQATADAILVSNGWSGSPHRIGGITAVGVQTADVDKSSGQYRLLCEYVRRGLLESSRRSQDRLRGREPRAADPAFSPEAVAAVAAGPALSRVLEMWLAERDPREKTKREWATAVRRFCELHGDLPADAITRAHVRQFKDALVKLPSALPHRVRKLPLPKIIAAAKGDDRPKLSRAAVGKQLTAVRSLLSWCVANGYAEHNAATGVTVASAKEVADKRVAYDDADLRVIFGDRRRFRESHPSRFWLPLLAAFTGCRLEELGQLTAGDVRHRNGTDYIDINAEGGKSLKTRSSVREVPVHDELKHVGFLEYAASRREQGDGAALFPDLQPDSLGQVTGRFSKWWTRYRRSLGITDARKPFHAFRATFKQACRAAGVGEEVHDAITGHSGGGVGRGYGGVPLAAKARAVKKLGYGVDLSNLHTPRRGLVNGDGK